MSRQKDTDALLASDAGKLRILADWHDVQDNKRQYEGEREVQADLRQIADKIETLQAKVEKTKSWAETLVDHLGKCNARAEAAEARLSAALAALETSGKEFQVCWKEAVSFKEQRDAALAANEALRGALNNITKGMIPTLPPSDDVLAFRTAMWEWSQKHAQEALAALPQQPEGDDD